MSAHTDSSNRTQLIISLVIGLAVGWLLMFVWGRFSEKWAIFLIGASVFAGFATITSSLGLKTNTMMTMGAILGVPLGYNIVIGYQENVLRKTFGNGYPIDVTDVFLFPLIFMWLVRIFVLNLPERVNLYKNWTGIMMAMVLVNLLSTSMTPEPFFGYSIIFVQIKLFIIFLFIANTFRDTKILEPMIWALVFAAFIQAFIATEQKFLGVIFTKELLGQEIGFVDRFGLETSLRVAGTLAHPNGLAMYLNMLLPTVIFYAISKGFGSYRGFFIWGVVILAVGAEIYTGSRGGWVGFIFGMGIGMYLWYWKQGRSPIVGFSIVGGIGGFGFLGLLAVSSNFRQRLFADDHGTAELRGILVDVAESIIAANPFAGIGLDHYTYYMQRYDRTTEFITSEYNETVHNTYLLIMAETGLIGLLLFLALLFTALYSSFKLFAKSEGIISIWALGILCSLLTWSMHSMVNHTNFYGEYMMWIMFGLIVALHQMNNRIQRDKQNQREAA